MYEVGEPIEVKLILDQTGLTVTYTVYDEGDVSFATGSMTEPDTYLYTMTFTPDARGEWTTKLICAGVNLITGFVYAVGMGPGAKIHASGDYVLYVVAPDMSTTVISDDGTDPALTAEVSQAYATELLAEADPAWSENFTVDDEGDLNLQSLMARVICQLKRTGGTAAFAKFELSNDAGSTWVPITDDMTTLLTVYDTLIRQGTMVPFATLTLGANQFRIRLVTWVTGGGTVESKVRSDSYLRMTIRKA